MDLDKLKGAVERFLEADKLTPGDCYDKDGNPNANWGRRDKAKRELERILASKATFDVTRASTTVIVGKEAYKGKTKAQATERAFEHLAQFMDGEGFTPELLFTSAGHVGVVYRDANGYWSYRIYWPEDGKMRAGSVTSGLWTREKAASHMRNHLAQAVFEPGDSARRAESLAMVDDSETRKGHVRWMDWQDAYAAARAGGLNDDDARRAANLV